MGKVASAERLGTSAPAGGKPEEEEGRGGGLRGGSRAKREGKQRKCSPCLVTYGRIVPVREGSAGDGVRRKRGKETSEGKMPAKPLQRVS